MAKRVALRRQAYDQLGWEDTPQTFQRVLDDVEGSIDSALELAVARGDEKARQSLAHQKAVFGLMREQGINAPRKGRMYEVSINADPDDFLDWDAPLSQQSEKVRQALKARGIETHSGKPPRGESSVTSEELADWGEIAIDAARQPTPAYNPSGSELLGRGSFAGTPISGGKRDITEDELRRLGIPGIKYLDQGSRAAGQGTRNYVVFDDKLIDIVKKYGIAGALSAGLINQMQAQQLTEHGYQ